MSRFIWPLFAATILWWTPTPTRAGFELVVNGNFDTGDFTGWTAGPGNYVTRGYGLDGGFGVQYGSVGVASQLYQMIPTTPGMTYTYRFWQETRGAAPNEFQAFWNGALILDLVDSKIATTFTEYAFTEVATKSITEIRFGLRQDPNYSALDAISVQLAGSVPEPSSLLMVGTALLVSGAGAAIRWGRVARRTRGPRDQGGPRGPVRLRPEEAR